MTEYVQEKKVTNMPRIPLEGSVDLTYRCNNNCRHCWLRITANSPEKENELTFDEIRDIVDEARKMGCRVWRISGGEPMLRPDFFDIFDYITSKSASYSINTNGTLITQKIAKLLKRKGSKMVALCGATAKMHDHITRTPGSFEAAMRGFAYLKEAGTGFTVQLIPMKDNYYQYKEMVKLAESLSPVWRIGAPWLYLSADGDPVRNREILRQRLDPKDVVELDEPDMAYEEWMSRIADQICHSSEQDDRLFASCVGSRRDFHIDPYGQMTFCCFIKEPSLRFDLRRGSFAECWDKFIPSLADKIRGGHEYLENCGSCDLRSDCRWCPGYGYLEHRRFSAKVEHLCDVAGTNRAFKDNWKKSHRRYYQIAGITIQVDSDLPITENTFEPMFKLFEVEGPGEDTISIRHHFDPALKAKDFGRKIYQRGLFEIYERGEGWIYVRDDSESADVPYLQISVINHLYTSADIYTNTEYFFKEGDLPFLTSVPSDQMFLAPVLADRDGCYLHASGVIFNGNGIVFVGHSGAGKSTIVKMLKDKAEILCDDRIIVRRCPEGFRIYGTWNHGEIPDVSPNSAPLRAILFLEKGTENLLMPLSDKRKAVGKLLGCLIKPFVTAAWWEKMLSLSGMIAREIPCYSLQFDKSGTVVDLLKKTF